MADGRDSLKRKYHGLSPMPRGTGVSSETPPPAGGSGAPPPPVLNPLVQQRARVMAPKRPRVDNANHIVGLTGGGGSGLNGGDDLGFTSSSSDGHGAHITCLTSQSGSLQYSVYDGCHGPSKKIETPENRAGVIIGQSLKSTASSQLQSGGGAVTVEFSSTPQQIIKTPQYTNEVMAEVDGSSDNKSTQQCNKPQQNTVRFEMEIPNSKVGLVFGKNKSNINSMQSMSGARIEVLGGPSTKRTVLIVGAPECVETAKILVNEVIAEGYRPPRRTWGFPGTPLTQQLGYGYLPPQTYPGAVQNHGTLHPSFGTYPPSGGYQSSNTTPMQQRPILPTTIGVQQQLAPGSVASANATNYSYGQSIAYGQDSYSGYDQSQISYSFGAHNVGSQAIGLQAPAPIGYQSSNANLMQQRPVLPTPIGVQQQLAPGSAASANATNYSYGQSAAYGQDSYSGYDHSHTSYSFGAHNVGSQEIGLQAPAPIGYCQWNWQDSSTSLGGSINGISTGQQISVTGATESNSGWAGQQLPMLPPATGSQSHIHQRYRATLPHRGAPPADPRQKWP